MIGISGMFGIVLRFSSLPRSGEQRTSRRIAGRGYRRAVDEARWWEMRPAQNLKPASYVCPLCDGLLHATSEHALIAPEGDLSRRRHAHLDCVAAARRAGRLPTRDEWRAGR
jgi:hypothetical protein